MEAVHRAMSARVDRGELPGLVTLVARGDDVSVDAIGWFDFEQTAPMRRDTIFRVASVTKPIVATAAMMLADDGLLPLEAPVERWLPELADRRVLRRVDGPLDETVPASRPITVADVLTYRMGYGMVVEPAFNPPYPVIVAAEDLGLRMGPPDPRTALDPDGWMHQFGTLPLMYQPGERWQYNVPALVLGVLVARAAGQPLPDVLAERVFEPLRMVETGFQLAPSNVDRLPSWYMTDFATGKLEKQELSPPDVWIRPPVFPDGAAGLLSTVDDLLLFARLLRAGGVHDGKRLLSEESVRLMTTNCLTDEQIARGGALLDGRGWGYGMSVTVRPDGVSAVPGRYGWEGGYGTSWFNHPVPDVTAILLSQTGDALFNGTLTEFGAAALAED
jgi:CubicO group peptidase (beta-lactamase class C family)